MLKKIKIFLLCRNNKRELELCLRSIENRTVYPYEIIIVDNNSSDREMLNYLRELQKINIKVHYNRLNLWVLGLNPPLRKNLSEDDSFYVVSDSDILVPIVKSGVCWLESLVSEMYENLVIGKLGLSLDLSWIAKNESFRETYKRESGYYNNPKIGENYISPVDTTLAIYRYDYFITSNPQFYPGHGVLARPHYYCCRTSKNLTAKHLGWRSYLSDAGSQSDDISKVICFTILGAYIDDVFLTRLPYFHQKLYRYIRPLARCFWAIFVIFLQVNWFLRNIPLNLNMLQTSLK